MSDSLPRCKAGRRCVDPETLEDGTPAARAVTDAPLCESCVQAAVIALDELPWDILEIGQRVRTPSMAVRMRDPDIPTAPRRKKSAPLPFDEFGFTLYELIVYELTVWAEAVADSDELPWDSDMIEHCRPEIRVGRACELLASRIGSLIDLPVQQQRARSLTENPADGHNPNTTTRDRGDYWANREGWEAAVRFIDLHAQAEKYIGRCPDNGVVVPCPRCAGSQFVREHDEDRVVCRRCHFTVSDDEFDELVEASSKALGLPSDLLTRSQAAALAGVKPGTVRKWVQRDLIRPLPGGGYRRVDIENLMKSRENFFGEVA